MTGPEMTEIGGWRTGKRGQRAGIRGGRAIGRVSHPVSIAVVALLLCLDSGHHAQAEPAGVQPPSVLMLRQTQPVAFAAPHQLEDQASDRQAEQLPALDLVQAYERMLLNDPQVQGARAAQLAGQDAGKLARAALLPQASINYMRNRTQQTEYYDSPLTGHVRAEDTFYGRRAGLTVEQTLFDYSAISTYRMGKTQAEYADIQYRLQFQQQAVTLIDAYLNAVLARDALALARRQVRVYQDMLNGNERLMAEGEGTRIDILETRTQLGATQAELVNHENALADRLRELSAIVGATVTASALLDINPHSGAPALPEDDLAVLQADIQQQNPEVQAARLAVRYNDLTVEREKGQFMPRVSLFATHERIVSDTINNKGRDYRSNTIGLQVSIPIFSGGSSYYATRQASHRLEQAQHELEQVTRSTVTTLEQYYRVYHGSAERVKTLQQNVADSMELIAAMHKSVAGGERTNTDALHAERESYRARQDLIRNHVEWLQAYAKLQFYAGRFSEDDVLALNGQLVAQEGN